MTIIDNYLAHLRSYLPDELQEEVATELEASLLDKKEEQEEQLGRKLSKQEETELVKQLGHPMQVASSYLPHQQLISSEYFPAFKQALKIGLSISAVIIVLLSLPDLISSNHYILKAFSIVNEFFNTALYVFALITLIFFIMQRSNVSPAFLYAWSPKELIVRSHKLKISRLESLFEVVIYSVFLAWWNNVLSFPTEVTVDNTVIMLALSSEWNSVFLSVSTVVGLSIMVSLHKIVVAGWNRFNLITDLLLNVASLVIVVQILQFDNFIIYSDRILENTEFNRLTQLLDSIVYSALGFIALVCCFETYQSIRRLTIKQ